MLVGALDPELVGPLVINGAPMSYWAGNDGENPMRYAGGMLGGIWPALLASDLGGGLFDGAHLVENFEYLNPANTYFDKYYNLFAKIDTEPERFLEFERWWGGFFPMDRQEIRWIVENLFVGNNLAAGEAEWSEGRAFDLRAIRSPIILFASLGDNITPPQQAFNWVADLYPTTEALKANGQVIVGLMHESVGHLGIFVSGQVAKREHSQIVDLIGYIEHLPPGLYGMQVEEHREGGNVSYDVLLTERRVEDLQVLQKYGRRDEVPFEAVEAVSNALASAYEAFVSPLIAPMIPEAAAKAARAAHPQRAQRWGVSDLNPFLWPLKGMAEWAKANRAPRDAEGPMAALERFTAAMTSAAIGSLSRPARRVCRECFFPAYPSAQPAAPEGESSGAKKRGHAQRRRCRGGTVAHRPGRPHDSDRARGAPVREGRNRTAAAVGHEADAGPRRQGCRPSRHAAGRRREIIRDQSYVVDFEPDLALATLPNLLSSARTATSR